MRRTTFAGLDQLEAGDPTSIDGGAPLGRDKATIDQYLSQIPGHHHTGAPAISNPTQAPTVSLSATVGHLPLNTTLYATYTEIDQYGGETTAAPFVSFATSGGIGQPKSLASATLDFASGSLPVNIYSYVFTITDGSGGETVASLPIRVERDPGHASAAVIFTGLTALVAATPGGTSWRLYKGVGGSPYALLATGTSATFTDTGLIPLVIGVQPPSTDTTNQTASFNLTVPYSSGGVGGFKVYLSATSTFVDPCLYGQYPQGSGAVAINITTLAVSTGSPPPVSTAVKMPSKINPMTEIEGFTGFSNTGPATWFFSLSDGTLAFEMFSFLSPSISGEFASFGADGSPNAPAISGIITVPAAPSGASTGGSAIVINTPNGPYISNLSSGAAAGITLYGQISAADATLDNFIVVGASAQVLPTDGDGTTSNLDTFSNFDWSTGVVEVSVGSELAWDPDEQWVTSSNNAGVYSVIGSISASTP